MFPQNCYSFIFFEKIGARKGRTDRQMNGRGATLNAASYGGTRNKYSASPIEGPRFLHYKSVLHL